MINMMIMLNFRCFFQILSSSIGWVVAFQCVTAGSTLTEASGFFMPWMYALVER